MSPICFSFANYDSCGDDYCRINALSTCCYCNKNRGYGGKDLYQHPVVRCFLTVSFGGCFTGYVYKRFTKSQFFFCLPSAVSQGCMMTEGKCSAFSFLILIPLHILSEHKLDLAKIYTNSSTLASFSSTLGRFHHS